MSFQIRTSKPASNDKFIKFYNTKASGKGLSQCITGKPTDGTCNVLANCVGWSCSRFNEIYAILTNTTSMKYPTLNCNAENWIERAKNLGLETGSKPKAGAIMVWQKGTLASSDGAGHVAIVEKVIDNNTVYTSESGYNSTVFWNATRTNSNGNWGIGSSYKFRAFIYNPAVKDDNVYKDECGCPYIQPSTALTIAKKSVSLEGTKWIQWYLCKLGYYSDSTLGKEDGYFGPLTEKAVKEFQKDNKLEVDGSAGPITRAKLIECVKSNKTKNGSATTTEVKTNGTTINATGSLKVGDIVNFTGDKQYSSSNGTTYYTCKPGLATVTQIYASGAHPYHLIKVTGEGSTVYGWVNASNIQGCVGNSSNANATVYTPKVGDTVNFTGNKHYAGANSLTGPACKPGKAKITAISENGKHPYHLIHVSGSCSTVYGWVDKNTFTKA